MKLWALDQIDEQKLRHIFYIIMADKEVAAEVKENARELRRRLDNS